MMFKKLAFALSAVAILGLAASAAGQTNLTNNKTVLTFSQPVEVPGHVLPAGSYTFEILDSAENRHIVQISNADGHRVIALTMTIPNYRLKVTGKTVVTFHETPAGTPEAIRGWFFPGHSTGEEFVYPKKRALELAAESNMTVLSSTSMTVVPDEEMKTAPVVGVTPDQQEVDLTKVVEPAPAPEPMATEPMAMATPPAPRQELPKTASSLPLIALCGLMSLALAGGFTLFSRRTSLARQS